MPKANPLTGKSNINPPKVYIPEMISTDLIDDNPLSANEQDTVTFKKLTDQVDRLGLIEIPVVMKKPDGRYAMISGKHRKDSFVHLGGREIPAIVIDKPASKEDEFNLVNNMNLIKGDMRKRELVKIIKENDLDPTKIDLLKMPSALLMPSINHEDLAKKSEELKRRARLNELVLEISKQIAEQVLREKDELVSLIVLNDTIAAVIRVPFKSKKLVRNKGDEIKVKIEKALMDVESSEESASE